MSIYSVIAPDPQCFKVRHFLLIQEEEILPRGTKADWLSALDEIEGVVPQGFQVDGVITSNGMAGYVRKEVVVEVMVANVNKATGIKQMLKRFGLSEGETLAIGDSNNDLPMLQFVSYSVAMKNAPDNIKEVVDDITEFTCDEDGVYHYLKSKFRLQKFSGNL